MSAFGTKRQSNSRPPMSVFGGKADITATERNFNLRLPQKLRQLGDVNRDPSPSRMSKSGLRIAGRSLGFSFCMPPNYRSILMNEKARPRSTNAKRKAAKMAAQEIDRLGDQTATREERARRKRRLIKGPREFRNIRIGPPRGCDISPTKRPFQPTI
jgi:hypothetical protein